MAYALKAVQEKKKVCFMSLVQSKECLFSYCLRRFCENHEIDFEDRDDWVDFISEDVTEFEMIPGDRLLNYDVICIDEFPEVRLRPQEMTG